MITWCFKKLVPHLRSIEVVKEVPWSPHDGIRIILNTDPASFMTSSFRRPRQLDRPPVRPGAPADEVPQATWDQTKQQKKQTKIDLGGMNEYLKKYTERVGARQPCEVLALEWAAWASTLEQWMLLSHPDPPDDGRRYCGRGQMPRMQKKPVLDRPRLAAAHLPVPGGLGIVEQL